MHADYDPLRMRMRKPVPNQLHAVRRRDLNHGVLLLRQLFRTLIDGFQKIRIHRRRPGKFFLRVLHDLRFVPVHGYLH